LRQKDSLSELLDAVLGRWGKIDSLICNAADFGVPGEISEVDSGRFAQVLQANVIGNFNLCQLVLGHMAQRRSGSVVLLTSIVAFTSMPNNIPYSSSKAAIVSMARSLAAAYATQGIRVNCVSPGLIQTDPSREIWEQEEVAREYIARRVPMNRIGQPSEIANVCLFLCSPLASYVNAAVVPVDGGRLGVGQPAGAPVKPGGGNS
jgi:dehydrogenase/reductase SDR family member 4